MGKPIELRKPGSYSESFRKRDASRPKVSKLSGVLFLAEPALRRKRERTFADVDEDSLQEC
jgi:hypothetical protein